MENIVDFLISLIVFELLNLFQTLKIGGTFNYMDGIFGMKSTLKTL